MLFIGLIERYNKKKGSKKHTTKWKRGCWYGTEKMRGVWERNIGQGPLLPRMRVPGFRGAGKYRLQLYISGYQRKKAPSERQISGNRRPKRSCNVKKSICFCIEQRNREGFNLLSGILMKYCQVEYCTYNEAVNYQPQFTLQQQRDMAQYRKAQLADSLDMLSGGEKVACCPRCHSTSISYGTSVSAGRAIVGHAVAGSTGAMIGGLSGNKGYAVCLKCGKRWKI